MAIEQDQEQKQKPRSSYTIRYSYGHGSTDVVEGTNLSVDGDIVKIYDGLNVMFVGSLNSVTVTKNTAAK